MNDTINDRIATLVSEIMKDQMDLTVDAADLAADTTFDDAGVDSLVLVEVAIVLRTEFGVEVTDEELANAQTISGAAAIVTERLATKTA